MIPGWAGNDAGPCAGRVRYRRRESPDPHETAEKVQALGRRFTAIQADLSRQDEIETIVDRAVAAMGRVDILVNNAGTIRRADALSFSEKRLGR